jgi:predicted RNA-binding protein with RPS1 domain
MLSRDRARREAAWDKLEEEFAAGNRVDGVIFGRVKGGFTVDLNGAVAFLPGSQVDIRPVRDVQPLMDIPQPFQILKMDRRRGNIVVSRRAVLEETRAEQRTGLIQSLAEGQIDRRRGQEHHRLRCVRRSRRHRRPAARHRHQLQARQPPVEVINIGDTVKVQIIRINRDTQRISLGMKQLESDPWEGVRRQVSDRRQVHRPRDQHHRIWCVRRAGSRHRGPGPRLRNELDQEERPSGQDRLDLAGSRRRHPRGRRREASHLARPQAGAGQSVGCLR